MIGTVARSIGLWKLPRTVAASPDALWERAELYMNYGLTVLDTQGCRMKTPTKDKAGAAKHALSREAIVRRLVMRHAEGSVSLHRGRYLTQSDVDCVVNRALSHDFSAYKKKK
jgi:hypothetical protein